MNKEKHTDIHVEINEGIYGVITYFTSGGIMIDYDAEFSEKEVISILGKKDYKEYFTDEEIYKELSKEV